MAVLAASVDRERREFASGRDPGRPFTQAVRLSRLRGFAHVLVRRPSLDRRREHPTHTFVLSPRHVRRGWELAYREMLPTDEYIRLSPVRATPIISTSCDLPERQALWADAPTSKPNPWATTSSPTPRGMNDDQPSSIYRYPRRIPEHFPGPPRSRSCKATPDLHYPPRVPIQAKHPNSNSIQTAGSVRPAARDPVGRRSPVRAQRVGDGRQGGPRAGPADGLPEVRAPCASPQAADRQAPLRLSSPLQSTGR